MNIEPLQIILSFSDNKKNTLLHFFSNDIKQKVSDLILEDKDFYIHDKVFCIKKNTVELEFQGKITSVENKYHLTIRKNSQNRYIDSRNYYIFVKLTKQLQNQRDFLEHLLQSM